MKHGRGEELTAFPPQKATRSGQTRADGSITEDLKLQHRLNLEILDDHAMGGSIRNSDKDGAEKEKRERRPDLKVRTPIARTLWMKVKELGTYKSGESNPYREAR